MALGSEVLPVYQETTCSRLKYPSRQRNRRRLDQFKAKQKEGLSEDDYKRYEKDVQKEHDKYIAEINEHLTHKEADLKTV